jgi:hypothetical protein
MWHQRFCHKRTRATPTPPPPPPPPHAIARQTGSKGMGFFSAPASAGNVVTPQSSQLQSSQLKHRMAWGQKATGCLQWIPSNGHRFPGSSAAAVRSKKENQPLNVRCRRVRLLSLAFHLRARMPHSPQSNGPSHVKHLFWCGQKPSGKTHGPFRQIGRGGDSLPSRYTVLVAERGRRRRE